MLNKATTLVCACAIALLTGCSGGTGKTFQPETALDRNWGRSYESAKYNQIANPNAGKSLKPVEGLDGQPAANVVDKYNKSFKETSKEENVTILKLQ